MTTRSRKDDELSGAVFTDIDRALRSKHVILTTSASGESVAFDKRVLAKEVLQDPDLREKIRESVKIVVDNMLITHVPIATAKVFKKHGYKRAGKLVLPQDFITAADLVRSEKDYHGSGEIASLTAALRAPLREFIRKYVEDAITKLSE